MKKNYKIFSTAVPSENIDNFLCFLKKHGHKDIECYDRGGYTVCKIDLSKVKNFPKVKRDIDSKALSYRI